MLKPLLAIVAACRQIVEYPFSQAPAKCALYWTEDEECHKSRDGNSREAAKKAPPNYAGRDRGEATPWAS